MASHLDTIFALSTGSVPSGVAVLRISGSKARMAAEVMCGEVPKPRMASVLPICDLEKNLLDRGIVLFFPGPHSFTGEDSLELQVHGSRAVIAAILENLGKLEGFRQAEAGEFSRRAFENGKLDLVEIEGLGELIHAETEAQRKLALRFSEGGVSQRYKKWMERLSFARAMLEAELDFSDESDIPGAVSDQIWPDLEVLLIEMRNALSGQHANEIVRDGLRVVIIGPPNSGKSSLLNYLAKRDVAIVTDIAGTTRDVISVDLDLGGHKISLIDTAGIRETADPVEKAGIERTGKEIDRADLVLLLTSVNEDDVFTFDEERNFVHVHTKADLLDDELVSSSDDPDAFYISTLSGLGIDSLLKRIQEAAVESAGSGESSVVLNSRHKNLIESSMTYVELAIADKELGIELSADYLRNAADQLGRIVGFVNADELLGLIFSQFCVGK